MSSKEKFFKFVSGLLLLIILSGSVMTAQAAVAPQSEDPPTTEPAEDAPRVVETRTEVFDEHQTTNYYIYDDGSVVEQDIVNGPSEPPLGYDWLNSTRVELSSESVVISDFPSYSWVFGCSAVSGAMVAGYYDRHGFPNMYTGSTNSGKMPLSDTSWSTWYDGYKTYPNNPLIASHIGVDGRTKKGSIDDYWVKSGSTAKDPYITGGWTQHAWGSAIGDYMKTSQSKYGNVDGSTMIHQYTSGTKMTCANMVTLGYASKDGTYGRKLFYQKRGYTVIECYNQATDNYATSGGFTLADYKAQIDAGNPVFISIVGHSMVGYGYGTGKTIYIRNTWDNNPSHTYSMLWGGSYAGREMKGARIVRIKKPVSYVPKPLKPVGATPVHKPLYKWTKVKNATNYIIDVYKGTTKLFGRKVSAASVCGPTTCQFNPGYFLKDGNYKWHVKALVGGIWRKFSAFKNFNVATPFNNTFDSSADLALWNKIVGPWSLYNGWYRTNGVHPYWNSIVHDGNYPKFKYIVRMRRINNLHNSSGIFVRATPYPLDAVDKEWDDFYALLYTNNGKFAVFKGVNGSNTALKGWTPTPAINQYGWNVLKVTGVGSTLKFYINGQLVWSGSDSSLGTGKVGIGFYKPALGWQPLLVDSALLMTNFTTSSEADVWAEMGETNTEWNNSSMGPPEP